MRYLVEGVEEGHDFIAFVGSRITQQNFQGCSDAVSLHFTENSAFLALDAVKDFGDVVDVLLVLSDVRIVRFEKTQRLLLLGRKVKIVQLLQQLHQIALSHDIFVDLVGLHREIVPQVRAGSRDSLPQNAIQKHQISDPVRVVQHPFLVLGVVEVKLVVLDARPQIGPGALCVRVLVEFAQVGRYAGVETADDVVEDLFLEAHLVEPIWTFETVLLVDEFPDIGAVVIGERLDVLVDVEILPPIVGLILHVPGPPINSQTSFVLPQILLLRMRVHLFSSTPKLRYILLVAATHRATLTLAQLLHHPQRALFLNVEPNDPEVFGLDQLLEQ